MLFGVPALELPRISLGLWHGFGDEGDASAQRAILRRAVELGITHFDVANRYGTPPGSVEVNLGRHLRGDLAAHRDALTIATKAGRPMPDGPFGGAGDGASRAHLHASLDASLRRLRVDHVDLFYVHRFDPEVDPAETCAALAEIVRAGKARHVGVSTYSPGRTAEAAALLRGEGVELFVSQVSYSLLNRWIEQELLATLAGEGIRCVAFAPLAQGLLTEKYLHGVPPGSRARTPATSALPPGHLDPATLERVRALAGIARERGQSLAQMAVSWVLRDPRVTTALVGASRPEQLDDLAGAIGRTAFAADELAAIDRHAVDAGVNLWAPPAEDA